MILRDLLPHFAMWDVEILGTDINREALKAASKGVYSKYSVSHMPVKYLSRYFNRVGKKFRLSDEIKADVKYRYHNLVADSYDIPGMKKVDIIFCRNVIIYFEAETMKRVVERFADCIVPDGFLFLGHAETLNYITKAFSPIETHGTIIYQKADRQVGRASLPFPRSALPSYPSELPAHKREGFEKVNLSIDDIIRSSIDLVNAGEFEKALKSISRVVEMDNLHLTAHYMMGVMYEKLERYEEAIEQFRRVLYIDQGFAICYFNLGNIYKALGKNNAAKREFKNCIKVLENYENHKEITFTDGMTAGVLVQAANHALKSIKHES
jgi:chemotaxis protein methyltransferase CheR